jgi:hypothetical protein
MECEMITPIEKISEIALLLLWATLLFTSVLGGLVVRKKGACVELLNLASGILGQREGILDA